MAAAAATSECVVCRLLATCQLPTQSEYFGACGSPRRCCERLNISPRSWRRLTTRAVLPQPTASAQPRGAEVGKRENGIDRHRGQKEKRTDRSAIRPRFANVILAWSLSRSEFCCRPNQQLKSSLPPPSEHPQSVFRLHCRQNRGLVFEEYLSCASAMSATFCRFM